MIIAWTSDDVYQHQLYMGGWWFAENWVGQVTASAAVSHVKNIHIIHHRQKRR
jgi:hypothetical protein